MLDIVFSLKAGSGLTTGEVIPGFLLSLLLCFGAIHVGLKKKAQRQSYLNMKNREPRKRLAIPLLISTPVTQEFSILTYDISVSGAFLPYDDLKQSMSFSSLIGKRSGIKAGDLIDIKLMTGRFSHFHCQARVVRYNFEEQTLSARGVGIEFIHLSKRKKRMLRNLIESSEAIAA